MRHEHQEVLDLIADYELSDAEHAPMTHVLLSRPPEFTEQLREAFQMLESSGCLNTSGAFPDGILTLTPTGLLLSHRANEVAMFAESLLVFFKDRLAEDGARFRRYTSDELRQRGIIASDVEIPILSTVINVFDLWGSSASRGKAKFDVGIPNDIIYFRTYSDIRDLYLRIERKRQEINGMPRPELQDMVLARLGSIDRRTWPTSVRLNRKEIAVASDRPDPKKVFVIHGRNMNAADEMSTFLRSLGLEPVIFNELRAKMGGTPSVAEIVTRGMDIAQAIVALFTGDEFSALQPNFRAAHDREEDAYRWQARPNVIFEAGMAFGRDRNRVIFVLLGNVSLFTDVAGIHVLRPNNHADGDRDTLRRTLQNIGCGINDSSAWMKAGNFVACVGPSEVSPRDPFRSGK